MDRDFKGVWIPKEIWLDNRLNALEKVIFVEIDSLDLSESGCFAGNEYIADFCQCSVRKVSDAISKLTELGYVKTESFDGRTRVLKICFANSASQPSKNCVADTQNFPVPTSNNNTSNNTNNKKERKRSASVSYDSIVNAYTANNELRIAIFEFIKMRKFLNKPMTSNALQLMLKKLNSLASDEATKIAIVNQSSMNSWLSVYPLKENYGYNSNQPVQQKYTIGEDGKKYDSWGNELL